MAKFSTPALLLRKTPYSETSLVLKFLTEDDGVQSYIFQGAQRKGKKGNILQSLAWVEISGFKRADSTLGKITEVSFVEQWRLIPDDIYRSTIVMFITELLNKVLTEETNEGEIYNFLVHFLQRLDQAPFPKEAHLFFLVQMIHYLGIQPQNIAMEQARYFDFLEGTFLQHEPPHHVFESGAKVKHLYQSFQLEAIDQSCFANGKERLEVMQTLLQYMAVHFDELDDLKTLDVLETIFQ